MTSATDATANATRDGGRETNDPVQMHTRLYCYLDRICMPLIEWTCVAGLPTLMCMHIIGFSLRSWSAVLSGEATGDDFAVTSTICGTEENYGFMQRSLLALVLTSIISLAVILFFGDVQANGINMHKRGMGAVVGSHLIPILYLALSISLLDGIIGLLDTKQTESCSGKAKEDYEKFQQMGLRLSSHLTFASLGGLAFALSCLWSQCNHRKYKCKRRGAGQDGYSTHEGSNHSKDPRSKHASSAEECNCPTMNVCWKVYSGLIILQSSLSGLSSNFDTHLLGMLHLVLLLGYSNKPTATALTHGSIKSQGAWQDAFTPGEWMAVSTLLTSLVGEYLLEYSDIMNKSKAECSSLHNNSLPLHLVVAHAGLAGCLIGVTLCSFFKASLPKSMKQNYAGVVGDKNMMRYLEIVLSLITVAGITFGFLDVALNSRIDIMSDDFRENFNQTTTTIPCKDWIPLPVQWLFQFLSCKLDATRNGGSLSILRGAVVGYWACVLAVCLPFASLLASWITSVDDANRKKRIIIVARKYFHFVAILLFAPITWLDPDMMALSYAIAIALLIVVEMVRAWIFDNGNYGRVDVAEKTISSSSSWNQFYLIFLDEKDSSAADGGLAVTHIALISGCAFPLWTSQLVHACMPSADQLSMLSPLGTLSYSREVLMTTLPFLGVFLLGIGDSAGAICGIMFGRHRWPGGSSRTLEGSVSMLLSLMIIVNAGTTKHYLANSEVLKDEIYYTHHTIPNVLLGIVMGTMALLEASTTQIDNLCLPIAGSTCILLMTALSR